MQKQILYYALKYDGNYDLIHKAIQRKEEVFKVEYEGRFVTILDEEYPACLLELKKPPYILFYRGNIELLKSEKIGVIGSRRANAYAIRMTKRLIRKLDGKYTIVSGMARGIDTIAHTSAITSDLMTIAVLGCGIDYVYPYENQKLYDYLCEDHLVISEYPNNIKPRPYYFPFRNRIIAALSANLYVMQASLKSGTLLTVNDALELDRDIYVLPYCIDDPSGSGCNMLIEQGANMIMIEDV